MVAEAKVGVINNSGLERIEPCLWFEDSAEEAARYYVSLFNDAVIEYTRYYTEKLAGTVGKPVGSVMTVKFRLPGASILALNGGPVYKLSPAISLTINCDTQEQIDYYWDRLSEGGTPMECGWVTDRFGLSWQVGWSKFQELLKVDPDRGDNMILALWQMKKLDVAALQRAYDEG